MTADIVDVRKNDVVIIRQNVGNMPPQDVDSFINKIAKKFAWIFGKGQVVVIPTRDYDDDWDLTIVRKEVPTTKQPKN